MTELDLEIITNQSPYPILVELNKDGIACTINVLGFKRFREETREYVDNHIPAWVLVQYEFIDSRICDLSRDRLLEYKQRGKYEYIIF